MSMHAGAQADAGGLADLASGLAEPIHDAQAIFRLVLDALSRPGSIQRLPDASPNGPAPLTPGATALLLTLVDGESTLFMTPTNASPQATRYLRFHTGVREAGHAAEAEFVLAGAAELDAQLLAALDHGSDESPQQGATLIVEAASLNGIDRDGRPDAREPIALQLTGPGIEHRTRLQIGGIGRDFWGARIALEAAFPRGIDLLLTCGPVLVGLPRSTRITWEA
jgi:alpha-D-ribose 1-methylphosphonate 5-triphosphate synthase subunit PhnH